MLGSSTPPEAAARRDASASGGLVARRLFTRTLLQTYLGRIGLVAFGFGTSIVTARTLGVDGRGELAILTTVPGLAALALEFGQEATTSHLVARSNHKRPALHANGALYALLVFVPGLGVVLAGFTFLLELGSGTLPLAVAGAASISATVYFYGASGFLLGIGRVGVYNVARVMTTAIFFAAVIVLAIVGYESARGFFLAVVGGHILVAVFLAATLRRHFKRPRWSLAKEQVMTGIRVHVSNVSQVILYRADQLVLAAAAGAAPVGHYVVAVNVAEALWHLPVAAGAVSVPYLSAPGPPEEKQRALIHAARLSLWLTIIGAAPLAAAAPFAIPLIFGEGFAGSVAPLELLLPGIVAASVGSTAMASLLAARRFSRMIVVTVASVAVNVTLMGLLIPPLEAAGAAIASSVAYGVFGAGALAAAVGVWGVRWTACLRPPSVWRNR